MQPIREPELLDPNRPLTHERDDFAMLDHRSQAERLKLALDDSCEYARQLWHQLDEVRAYLVRSLPDDPQRPDAERRATSPTGPDDEAGWTDWMKTYASVISSLCGPRGDSGFGADEARKEAHLRRDAPVPVVAPGAEPVRRRRWWRRRRR
jgi:hypothetical protein